MYQAPPNKTKYSNKLDQRSPIFPNPSLYLALLKGLRAIKGYFMFPSNVDGFGWALGAE